MNEEPDYLKAVSGIHALFRRRNRRRGWEHPYGKKWRAFRAHWRSLRMAWFFSRSAEYRSAQEWMHQPR